MEMKALLTTTIGDEALWEYTLPSMRAACRRHGWAFERITTCTVNETRFKNAVLNICFEKFRVADYLDRYDRVVMLDADTLVSPRCPDIFAEVPEEAIGGVFEDVGDCRDDRLEQIRKIRVMSNDLRLDGWSEGYLNAGVMVFSKYHREALTLDFSDRPTWLVSDRTTYPDQNTMNYLCWRSGFAVCGLGFQWNHTEVFSDADWHESHIKHYAGVDVEDRCAMAKADSEEWFSGREQWT